MQGKTENFGEYDIEEKKLSFAESHAMLDKINKCSYLGDESHIIYCQP